MSKQHRTMGHFNSEQAFYRRSTLRRLAVSLTALFLVCRAVTPARAGEDASDVIFDFAKNINAAHFRSDGLLIDFGTKARYKYTLADDAGGWCGNGVEDDLTYSDITGSVGRILFFADADETGPGTISVRARFASGRPVLAVLNGTEIGRMAFAGDRFSVAEATFEKSLREGVNTLELRPARETIEDTAEGARVSVDYVRIIPDNRLDSESIRSFEARTFDERRYQNGIPLTADESVTFNTFIPEGATLVLEARFDGPSRGEVDVEVESETAHRSYRLLEDAADDDRLEIDLSPFEGQAAAVRFTADGEAALLTRAVMVQPFSGARHTKPRAKNVLVVLVDTLRADRLRLFNRNSRVNSPYISRLGAESLSFTRASAPSNWTKPSVATLFTGVTPKVHGANTHSDVLSPRLTMASEVFQRSGFDTAGFVANGYISSRFGFGRGWNYLRIFGGETGRPDRAGNVVENALKWLEKHPKNKRFFMYVHTIDPHAPYVSPKKYQSLYDRFFYRGFIKPSQTASILNQVRSGALRLDGFDKAYLEALYDGEITYIDEVIGHLMRTVRKLELLDDTLVIFTSDHGEEFFEHGSLGHGHTLYEELLRIPLIIRLPGAQFGGAGRIRETGLADLLPTMCDVLRVECPPNLQGSSLLSSFYEDEPASSRPTVSEYPSMGQTAVRMGRFKALFNKMNPVLYDLENDPSETTDVSAFHTVTLAALRDALGAFVAEEAERAQPSLAPLRAAFDPDSEAGLRALGYLGD